MVTYVHLSQAYHEFRIIRCPKIVIGLRRSVIDYFVVIACLIAFSCFKTFMAHSLILSLPILFGCRFLELFGSMIIRLTCKKDKWCHHQQQMKSSLTTRKLKMKPWTSPHLFGVEDLKYLLAWLFDCYRKSLSLSFLDQHFIFGYLKPLMHIVWSPFAIQSFLFNLIKSYLLSANSSPLASLNIRTRILFRWVVRHNLKFPFQNVNHFPQ
jgi:hypothetical protein